MPSHDDDTSLMAPPNGHQPIGMPDRKDQGGSSEHRLRLPWHPDNKGHARSTTGFTLPGDIDACAAGTTCFIPTFLRQTCVVGNGGRSPDLCVHDELAGSW